VQPADVPENLGRLIRNAGHEWPSMRGATEPVNGQMGRG
jgi:hypothetical protein